MKNVMKQSGKAICYFLLFLGVQTVTTVLLLIGYGLKIGSEAAQSGAVPTEQEILEQSAGLILEQFAGLFGGMVLVSGLVTLFILWLFFLIRKKNFIQEVSLHRIDKTKILPLILLGAGLSLLLTCILSVLPMPQELMESYGEASQGLLVGSLPIRLLSNVIVAPIVEEVIFRGLIFSRLKKAMKVWPAIIISSLLFGLGHGQLLWIIYAFVFGVLLAVVADRFNTIGASILLHMGFNLPGTLVETINYLEWPMLAVGAVSLVIIVAASRFIIKKNEIYDPVG